jgi:hypothetical protein
VPDAPKASTAAAAIAANAAAGAVATAMDGFLLNMNILLERCGLSDPFSHLSIPIEVGHLQIRC